jgi:hypothetical protein
MYWESADPPYFQSVGTLAPDDQIDFAYDGQHTEFPGTVRISRDSAFQARMVPESYAVGTAVDLVEDVPTVAQESSRLGDL